jgi:hypothetical protein
MILLVIIILIFILFFSFKGNEHFSHLTYIDYLRPFYHFKDIIMNYLHNGKNYEDSTNYNRFDDDVKKNYRQYFGKKNL